MTSCSSTHGSVLPGRGSRWKRSSDSSAPRRTRSLAKAQELLGLERLTVVYPGDQDYPLADGIHARGLESLIEQAADGCL